MKKKVLFICTANLQRSPTAHMLANEEFGEQIEAKSAGVACNHELGWFGDGPLTQELVDWADEIVTMEPWQSAEVEKTFKRDAHCIEIADVFDRSDARLKSLLRRSIECRLKNEVWLRHNMVDEDTYREPYLW